MTTPPEPSSPAQPHHQPNNGAPPQYGVTPQYGVVPQPMAAQQPYGGPQQPYGSPPQYVVQPQYAVHPQYMTPPKSRVAAVLLCFFLGNLGIHNFYLGYTGRGIVQLLLALAGYTTAFILIGFVFLVPLWIWVIVELIALLVSQQGTYSKSANGVPLT